MLGSRRSFGLALILAHAAGAQDDGVTTTAKATPLARMECVSRVFLSLDKALGRTSDEAVLRHALALEKALESVCSLEDKMKSDTFRSLSYQAKAVSRSIVRDAKARQRRFVRHGVEQLRATCTACHAATRAKNEERGWFPAHGNTIHGRVRVTNLAGKPRPAQNVVVFVDFAKEVPKGRVAPFVPLMSQKNQRFAPRVLPVVVGAEVAFPNDDRVFHNVFSKSKAGPFDFEIYSKGKVKTRVFAETGLIRIFCNIHPKMAANILVLANPFFSVTDATGCYAITGLPDGKYRLRSWHEFGGGKSVEVEVKGGAVRQQGFSIRETKRMLPHKNKHGLPYRKKY